MMASTRAFFNRARQPMIAEKQWPMHAFLWGQTLCMLIFASACLVLLALEEAPVQNDAAAQDLLKETGHCSMPGEQGMNRASMVPVCCLLAFLVGGVLNTPLFRQVPVF